MVDLSTKLRNGTVVDLLRAIKVIRKIKEGAATVKFRSLGDISTWKLACMFSDASHANMSD